MNPLREYIRGLLQAYHNLSEEANPAAQEMKDRIAAHQGVKSKPARSGREIADELGYDASEAGGRALLGSCVNSFDGDGYCIQPGIPYGTTSDLAVGDENAEEITEEEFRAQTTVPAELEQKVAGHEVFYLLDKANDHYMLYDADDDVHYFFGGNR